MKKREKSKSSLQPLDIIGIKSNVEYRLPMVIFTQLLTMLTVYFLAKIMLDSFLMYNDFPAEIYNAGSTRVQTFNFTDDDIKHLQLILFLGCAVICFVNGLKKHLIKSVVAVFSLYLLHFGIHYKYVVNGYFHAINKAMYAITMWNNPDISASQQFVVQWYTPSFDLVDVKLELAYFIMFVVFGVCFLLAYACINHINPILLTLIVSVITAIPLICNTFVGEIYLLSVGMICIIMFVIHVQGYSNFASKKIFAGFRNSIKIRGRYVSFSAFQQATVFLVFSLIVLAASNYIIDFNNYKRNTKVDEFGKDLLYSIQNFTKTDRFNSFDNSSAALNNGDLKNMNNLDFTQEVMFEIKTTPESFVMPLYLRAYTAANYSDEAWTPLKKNIYKNYDIWYTFSSSNFYPQFCSGDAAEKTDSYLNDVEISINCVNINPNIFLSEYRMITDKTQVLGDASAFYDNEFRFNSFGGMKSYDQRAVVRGAIPPDSIYADINSLNGNLDDLLYHGDFYCEEESSSDIYDENLRAEFNSFKENEKLYRAFVMDNYRSYPDDMDSYLPETFDSDIRNLYDSFCYDEYFSYYLDEYDGTVYSLYSYEDNNPDSDYSYNEAVVPQFYNAVFEYIKDYIHSRTEYSLSPGKKPNDKELVEYFLNESHKGYCVHYATAATLMLRRAGIPARYVEGYFVSDYDLSMKNSKGYSAVRDSNAHAWTEVYYPIIGWQVVDFTPYYSDKTFPEENKMTSDDNKHNTDVDSDIETDTQTDSQTSTDSELQTDTDTAAESDTDTNADITSTDTDGSDITASSESQQGNSGVGKALKAALGVLLIVFKVILTLGLIVGIWFLIRFIVRKIRFKRFHSADTRKAVKAMYLHSLLLFRIIGVVPEKNESDQTFAKRAVVKLDDIKSTDYQQFTLNALNARFGKNTPSKESIEQMNNFLEELFVSVYNSCSLWKKIFVKFILFLG